MKPVRNNIHIGIVLLIIACLLGCGNSDPKIEEVQSPSNWDSITRVISLEIGATSYTYLANRGQSSDSAVTLTFNNVRWSNRANYTQLITSYCAFRAFDLLADSLRDKYKNYNVVLNTDHGPISETHSENIVGWAHLAWHVVDGYFEQLNDSHNYAVDTSFISQAQVDSSKTYINEKLLYPARVIPTLTGYMPTAPYEKQWITYWITLEEKDRIVYGTVSVALESMRISDFKYE